MKISDLRQRIEELSMPEPNSGCWLWLGAITPYGYAKFYLPKKFGGKQTTAHRALYEILYGPVPHPLQLDHKCRVRSCINPDHLEMVTNKINALRGISFSAINAKKTHCVHGHPFDGVNTYVRQGRYGGTRRTCRICERTRLRLRMRTVRRDRQRQPQPETTE